MTINSIEEARKIVSESNKYRAHKDWPTIAPPYEFGDEMFARGFVASWKARGIEVLKILNRDTFEHEPDCRCWFDRIKEEIQKLDEEGK